MALNMVLDKIDYTVIFLTDWHAGSGLSSGAEADAVVIKDKDGFPFIPGKTMKGLFVDAYKDFMTLGIQGFDFDNFKNLFGYVDENTKSTFPGKLFFSNVSLPIEDIFAIGLDNVGYLYRNIASTSIDSTTGVAKLSSLRVKEVCIPISLDGFIHGEDLIERKLLERLIKYIRGIGANRNRGLGRCTIKIK